MTTIEEKERHSWRRRRNFLAKETKKSGTPYREKVVEVKHRDKKISTRNVEEFIDE